MLLLAKSQKILPPMVCIPQNFGLATPLSELLGDSMLT